MQKGIFSRRIEQCLNCLHKFFCSKALCVFYLKQCPNSSQKRKKWFQVKCYYCKEYLKIVSHTKLQFFGGFIFDDKVLKTFNKFSKIIFRNKCFWFKGIDVRLRNVKYHPLSAERKNLFFINCKLDIKTIIFAFIWSLISTFIFENVCY